MHALSAERAFECTTCVVFTKTWAGHVVDLSCSSRDHCHALVLWGARGNHRVDPVQSSVVSGGLRHSVFRWLGSAG
eukprot:2030620-Alexandrium_andersonii.AAC.1